MAKPTCSVADCPYPVDARGWCRPHYRRWARYGDPEYVSRATPPGAPLAFAMAAVDHQGDDCLVWPYAKDRDGYGFLTRNGKYLRATRFVLTLAAGEPPAPDAVAAHLPIACRNPSCVNPRHLRWATPTENNRDQLIDGTFSGFTRAAS